MDYQIERYSLIFWSKDGRVGFDTSKGPDGEWVRYVEYTAALAEARAEIALMRSALEDIAARGPDTDSMYAIAFELASIARAVLNTPKTGE